MNGLNEAGRFLLNLESGELDDQRKRLNLRQLKYAIAEMVGNYDPNYTGGRPDQELDHCLDCHRMRDDEGNVPHARDCVFDTFAKFQKNPADFGLTE